MEIERFWVIRKFSWATFLFFANRYLAVIGYLPVIMEVYWTAPKRELVRFTTLFLSFNVLISIRLDVRDAVGLDGFYRLRLTITDRCHYAQTYRQFLIVLIQICVGGEALRYGLLSQIEAMCSAIDHACLCSLRSETMGSPSISCYCGCRDIYCSGECATTYTRQKIDDSIPVVCSGKNEYHYEPTYRSGDPWLQ